MTQTGPTGTIDLGGIGVIAPGTSLVGSSLAFQGAGGTTIANMFDANGDLNKRIDGIRYDSPSLAGFQLGASYGEASGVRNYQAPAAGIGSPNVAGDLGNAYAVNLRYAGEMSGVRIAAGVGYERLNEDGVVTPAGSTKTVYGGSLSLMHVPTGLFVQGHYNRYRTVEAVTATGNVWHIAGGIAQNWFGIGNTSLYGEYGRGSNMWAVNTNNLANVGNLSFWGIGMVQHVNAAAMQLYLGYRSYSSSRAVDPSISVIGGGARIAF